MYNSPYKSPYMSSMISQKQEDPLAFRYSKEEQNMDNYGSSIEPSESFKASIPQNQVQAPQGGAGVDPAQVGTSALGGAAVGGPAGAAVAAGGSLLSQYIAQKAADERAKREGIGQAYAKQASDEQNIINSIMATNARALR
jgi:hypothetical protein